MASRGFEPQRRILLLEAVRRRVLDAQKQLFERHQEAEKKIEEKFNVKIENLEEEKKKEIAKIVEDHGDDTERLAKMVAEALSAEYAKKEWENKSE